VPDEQQAERLAVALDVQPQQVAVGLVRLR
jgi:hypothetical protein